MTFTGIVSGMLTVPAGGAAVSATNGAGGPSTVTIPAANYYVGGPGVTTTDILAEFQTQLNTSRANGWTVTLSATTGKVTIDCSSTPWSITWTSTALRDLLGFTGNISSVSAAQTGSNQCRGIWMPDCPAFLDGHYLAAPRASDLRQTESPTGVVIGHVGNIKYRHRNLRYSHVPVTRTWKNSESTTYESLEQFMIDTQWGQGHSWFSPSAKCQIKIHSGDYIGNETLDGWYLKGTSSMDDMCSRAGEAFDGYWTVRFAELVSDS